MRLPTRKSELLKRTKAVAEDLYLTKEAIERMKRTLSRLEKTERRAAAEEMRRTAEMGDLSENAAYQAAKANLRRINDRITTLEEKLKHAIPIEQGAQADGAIRIGSVVKLRANDREHTYEILGPSEVNPSRGRISYRSPLGSLLMGKRAGETVTLKTPAKETFYKIADVK